MPGNANGVVSSAGYQYIGSLVGISAGGLGFGIVDPPPLPANPYLGFLFLGLPGPNFGPTFFASKGRKLFRDGVIIFPDYPDSQYQIIAIFSPIAIGRTWYAQW